MPGEEEKKRALALESLLMDAMHAMQSMDQVEKLGLGSGPDESTKNSKKAKAPQDRSATPDSPETMVERLTDLTSSAFRFAVRTTDTSRKVARALIKSQDQMRMALQAGKSLKDVREVAGLTLSEMSEALNLKDKSILEAVENGTATLSFELILRLAALVARNDPIPFILKYTRNYNPEAWKILEDWGVGRLPLQFEREREFINIFRRHDDARKLSDEGFQKVLEFTRRSFEMSLHFVAEQEEKVAAVRAEYAAGQPQSAKKGRKGGSDA